MISALPKLRPDLAVSRQETDSGTVLVLKDPVGGRFFRMGDTERFIAEQLDGNTTLDVVRRRTEEKFDASLRPEVLDAFLENLKKAHLLETDEPSKPGRPSRGKRIRGSPLYLRVPLFDPDRLFARLSGRLRFLFTGRFMAVSVALILVAAAIAGSNAGPIAQEIPRLYRLAAVPLFVLVILLIGTIHEFGHGVTCKHFGGAVHEVGFMLLYFQPAFYCNVSDAWLFPQRSKRLWVGLAGPYSELCLWAMATVAWRVTEVDTWIHYVALTTMMISGLKSLIDLNPFVKLDGYYLLSDYLDIPNLRSRSFRYVGDAIRRLLGLSAGSPSPLSRRERRIYLIYGLAGTVGSLALLSYGFLKAGEYLLDRHQVLTFLLLAGLVAMISSRRFRKLFGRAKGKSEPRLSASPSTQANPAGPEEESVISRRKRGQRRLLWTAAAAAVLAFVLIGRIQLRIAGPFDALPEHNADIRAAVDGIVGEVLVDEGTIVKAGDVIARLSDVDLRPESRLATVAVANAGSRLGYAQNKLARARGLFKAQVLSRQELEDAQQEVAAASSELSVSRTRLSVLEERLGLLDLISPVDGVVATPSRELHALKGQLVGKGALIAKVYEVKTITVQIAVPEKEISDVQVGHPVLLRSRAYPNIEFQGRVAAIGTAAQGTSAPVAAAVGGDPSATRMFMVTTHIDNQNQLLKPGMTGQAKILCGKRSIAGLITRRLTRTFKVEFWSWL